MRMVDSSIYCQKLCFGNLYYVGFMFDTITNSYKNTTLNAYKQAYESQPKTYPPRLLQCDTLLASDTAYSKAMGDTNTAAIGAMSCAVSDENVSVCKGDERDKTLVEHANMRWLEDIDLIALTS
eukprot:700161_1